MAQPRHQLFENEKCDEEDDAADDEEYADYDGDIRGSEASDLGHSRTRTVQNHHC